MAVGSPERKSSRFQLCWARAKAVHHGRDLLTFAREDTDPINFARPEGPWGPWSSSQQIRQQISNKGGTVSTAKAPSPNCDQGLCKVHSASSQILSLTQTCGCLQSTLSTRVRDLCAWNAIPWESAGSI